jgi:hypothetical protein
MTIYEKSLAFVQKITRRQPVADGYYQGDTFLVRFGKRRVECTLLHTYHTDKARVSYQWRGVEYHADVTSDMLVQEA